MGLRFGKKETFRSQKVFQMQTKIIEVTSEKKKVAEVEVEQFENLDEALAFFKVGDNDGTSAVLKLVNTQHKTNKMNAARAQASGKPSKTELRNKAFASLSFDELKEVANDSVKFNALLDAKVEQLEAEWAAQREAERAKFGGTTEEEAE